MALDLIGGRTLAPRPTGCGALAKGFLTLAGLAADLFVAVTHRFSATLATSTHISDVGFIPLAVVVLPRLSVVTIRLLGSATILPLICTEVGGCRCLI